MNFFGDLLKNGNNDALDLPDVAEYRWKKPAENESEQGAGSDDVENGQSVAPVVEQEPAGQLQQAMKLPELPDFQTWLAQQGGKYGDVGDVLGYDFKQAKQDYEDFVDPEARARREKAAESRRRLATLGDIALVIGDIVGAAAGGNVNRRGKSAGEVDYALRQAEENKNLQREALLLQRYRQAADRGIANARQDYAQVMQRYLSDQQNALRQQALANEAKEIDYSHQQWLGEHELNERKQAEKERNNKILEDIAREKARVSGVRADAYASGINGLKKKFLENSFGVETTDPNTGAFVSKQTFGEHLGTMLKYTGIGSGGFSDSNSISYKWAELGLEKEKNEGIYQSIKSMVDAGKKLKDEKTPSTQQIQKYMSALVGLYNDVTSEGFMLRDKKGRDLPRETADFVNRVETNVIEVMRLVKLAERDNLNAYSNDVNALYMRETLLETVDDALKK